MNDDDVHRIHSTPNRPRRGAALVEMAIVLPLLILLTFAALEYGWMFFRASQVNQAARHGTRIAVRPQADEQEVTDAVDAVMAGAGLSASGYTVEIRGADGTALTDLGVTVGSPLTVHVAVPYPGISLTGAGFVPVPDTLLGQATMAKEGPS